MVPKNLSNQLSSLISKLSFEVSLHQQEKLLAHLELLNKWNRIDNLTAIRDPDKALTHHVMDSLSVAPHVEGARILDFGTGAGFPGIPLAVLFPEKHFVLLDSNKKKTRFLKQVCLELELTNAEVLHERVENYSPAELFPTVLCRAVASVKELLQIAGHLTNKNGIFLIMKGSYPAEELVSLPEHFAVSFCCFPFSAKSARA